uniref:Peptidylglycine alpha-amidating monooxygenase n=1 Tax=Rousettus aegyptiacus TaxID=9407 RepID=A0A7J8F204_ROUAE|nr:peptidylglycine alpha-amidating monooxygenase [Rousettus aegyptiacus]
MAGVRSLLVLLVFQSSCLGFRSPLSVFKRFKETTRSFSNECLGTTRPVIPIDSSDFTLDIRMPGITPKQVRGIQYFIMHLFCVQSIIKAKNCIYSSSAFFKNRHLLSRLLRARIIESYKGEQIFKGKSFS